MNYVFSFKYDCIKFLSGIVIKLLERCPLKYSLVQSLVIVVPQKLISASAEAQVKFERLADFTQQKVVFDRSLQQNSYSVSSKALYWK